MTTRYGHEEDPVQDACMEHRAATAGDGHWSDVPCVCAIIRLGIQIERERKAQPHGCGWVARRNAAA